MIPGLIAALVSAGFAIVVPVVVRVAVDAIPRMVTVYELYEGTPADGFLFAYFGYALVLVAAGDHGALASSAALHPSRCGRPSSSRAGTSSTTCGTGSTGTSRRSRRGFYHRFPTGDVMTRATSDIEKVRRYIGPAHHVRRPRHHDHRDGARR